MGERKDHPIGLREVAEAAGVSARTVSRVMRDEGSVAPATRDRIKSLAEQMGYRPNLAAKSLRSQRVHEIVLVVWSMSVLHEGAELYLRKIEGLEHRLHQDDLPVKIRIGHQSLKAPERPARLLSELIHARPLGTVLFPLRPDITAGCVAELEAAGIPTVVLDEVHSEPSVTNIGVDRVRSVHDAMLYLASRARRHIAYLGPDGVPSRMDGYHAALTGLGQDPLYLFTPVAHTSEALFQQGRIVGRKLAERTSFPDAVQAYSDPLAIGFIQGLKEVGIRVPDDVAVVGFDDRWSAVICHPSLTTIAHPNREVGIAAADVLFDKIAGREPPPEGWSRNIPGKLVIREST